MGTPVPRCHCFANELLVTQPESFPACPGAHHHCFPAGKGNFGSGARRCHLCSGTATCRGLPRPCWPTGTDATVLKAAGRGEVVRQVPQNLGKNQHGGGENTAKAKQRLTTEQAMRKAELLPESLFLNPNNPCDVRGERNPLRADTGDVTPKPCLLGVYYYFFFFCIGSKQQRCWRGAVGQPPVFRSLHGPCKLHAEFYSSWQMTGGRRWLVPAPGRGQELGWHGCHRAPSNRGHGGPGRPPRSASQGGI